MGHPTIRKYALYFESLVLRMGASYQLTYQTGKAGRLRASVTLAAQPRRPWLSRTLWNTSANTQVEPIPTCRPTPR